MSVIGEININNATVNLQETSVQQEHIVRTQKELSSGATSQDSQDRLRTETRTDHLNLRINHKINPDPSQLAKLVGMDLIPGTNAFSIHDSNFKQQMTGIASFQNTNKSLVENIAWYWSPKNGFQVITSKSSLQAAYHTSPQNVFQFYKLSINDYGVVAGSFLIDQQGYKDHNNMSERYVPNRCPWFTWSSEDGLYLSEIPSSYQLVEDINNRGELLISEINRSGLVIDTHKEFKKSVIPYPDLEMVKNKIALLLPLPPGSDRDKYIKKFQYRLHTNNAESIDDNGLIKGTMTLSVINNNRVGNGIHTVIVHFETSVRGIENIHVHKINNTIFEKPQIDSASDRELPKHVFFIFQQYKTLQEVLKNRGDKGVVDAFALFNYHLLHPDSSGQTYNLVHEYARPSNELEKLCLPSRPYIRAHLKLIETLGPGILDCPERDAYFVSWFNHEFRRLGMEENEFYIDFLNRKYPVGSDIHLNYAISRVPLEVKCLLPDAMTKERFWSRVTHSSFRPQSDLVKYTVTDIVEIINRYKLCPPLFFGEDSVEKSFNSIYGRHDTFSYLLRNWHTGYSDPRFMPLLIKSFPNQEYRNQHPDKLNEYLDHILWYICHSITLPKIASEFVHLLEAQGVDVQAIAKKSNHSEVHKFFKEHYKKIYL